jgi:hypothetical protein
MLDVKDKIELAGFGAAGLTFVGNWLGTHNEVYSVLGFSLSKFQEHERPLRANGGHSRTDA